MKRLLIILLLFPAILQAQTTYPIRGISRVVYGGDTLDTKFSTDSTKFVTNNKAFVFNKIVKVNKDTLATNAYARSVGGGGTITSDSLNFSSDLLYWDRPNRTYKPYTSKPTGLGFYTGTTNPDGTTRLNLNGHSYATGYTVPSISNFGIGYSVTASGNTSSGYFGTVTSISTGTNESTASSGILLLSSENNILGQFLQSGNPTAETLLPAISIRRTYGGTQNCSGDFIKITDNPTTTGTRSGKVLTATVGSTERVSLNPRATGATTPYIFASHNKVTGNLFEIWQQDRLKASVDSSGNIKANFISRPWGANVTAASTITPTGPMFKVTGTTTIDTINLPYTGFSGEIKILFVNGSIELSSSGNIGYPKIISGQTLCTLVYNPTDSKWYVSN